MQYMLVAKTTQNDSCCPIHTQTCTCTENQIVALHYCYITRAIVVGATSMGRSTVVAFELGDVCFHGIRVWSGVLVIMKYTFVCLQIKQPVEHKE